MVVTAALLEALPLLVIKVTVVALMVELHKALKARVVREAVAGEVMVLTVAHTAAVAVVAAGHQDVVVTEHQVELL